MRVGDRVQRVKEYICAHWDDDKDTHVDDEYVLHDGVGTVIEITEGCDNDGYERIEELEVRWDNGKLETFYYDEEKGPDLSEVHDVTPRCYVNVYLYDRAYGGSEEGGWWYSTYEPIEDECEVFDSEAEAAKARDAKQSWCDENNKGRRPVSSVLSEGEYVVRLESHPAEYSPSTRPHYC